MTGFAEPRIVRRHVLLGPARQLSAAVLVCCLLVASLGCETDDSVGSLLPSCIIFTPEKEELEPGAEEVVAQWGLDSTCDTAEVELRYTGALPVWAASFTVEYPSAFSQFFLIETADGFLFEDGVDPIVNVGEVVSGRVVVGITRTDSEANAGITPSENTLLARLLFFRVTSSGSGDVTFTEANLEIVENPGDIPAEAVPAVPFIGGSFDIEN